MIARSEPPWLRPTLLAFGLCWSGVTAAKAHAPPEVRRLLFDVLSADAAPRVLVANRGLIFRDGDALQLMCNEALLLNTSELPAVVPLDEQSLLAATPSGLFSTRDRGCSWERQEAFDASLSATRLVQAPDAPAELWLAASSVRGAGSGSAVAAGIYVSTDVGRSWELRWRAQPTDFLQDLLLAPGSRRQVYVLRAKLEAGRVLYSVLQSPDGGQSWQEQALSLQDDEQPTLLSVDPREPTRLIAKAARSGGSLRDRLLVRSAGAESFEAPVSLYAISAASWSEDGARAWVASEEGLYLSTDHGASFARAGPGELLSCVEERAGRVYTCGFFAGVSAQMEGVGVSDDAAESFQPLALFRDVQASLACPAEAETLRRCELPWQDWQNEQGVSGMPAGEAERDAGVRPAHAVGAKHGTGCSAFPRPRGPGGCTAGAMLLLLAAARSCMRRRERSSRRRRQGRR